MNFTLSQNDPTNTVFTSSDGRPVYHIETPYELFAKRTRVMDVSRGRSVGSVDVGAIEWHSLGDTMLEVGGRNVRPMSSGIFSNSQIFRAHDGVEYKWKIVDGLSLLVVNNHSGIRIATFQRAKTGFFSRSRPASLFVVSQGIHILDEIVTTFVWFEEKRRRREHRNGSGASANAAAAANAGAMAAAANAGAMAAAADAAAMSAPPGGGGGCC